MMLLLGSNRCQNLRIKNLAFVISTFKVTLKWRRMDPLSMYFTSFIELSKTPQDTSAPQTPLLEELPGLHDDGILTAKDGAARLQQLCLTSLMGEKLLFGSTPSLFCSHFCPSLPCCPAPAGRAWLQLHGPTAGPSCSAPGPWCRSQHSFPPALLTA